MMKTAKLLLHCPDKPGILAEVTDFITGTRKDLPEEEWVVVERPEMRIISDELFNRAQALLEQRSNEFKLNNKREKTEYVFSTLIYCKHCGYSFSRRTRADTRMFFPFSLYS